MKEIIMNSSRLDINLLRDNIDQIHTTKLGLERIKRNIKLDDNAIDYLKNKINDSRCVLYKKGKNYYCDIDNITITINSYNYCIITAHKKV